MAKNLFAKKDWWKSKTIWGNALALLGSILAALNVNPEIFAAIAAAAAVFGIYGRVVTNTEIKK